MRRGGMKMQEGGETPPDQQTVEISENITSWNVQVVNLGNELQSAGECLITNTPKFS